MLALLKPWCSIRDLKQDDQHFCDTYTKFMLGASDETVAIVENIKYFRECADSARNHYATTSLPADPHTFSENELVQDNNIPQLDNQPVPDNVNLLITEEDVQNMVNRMFAT